MTRMLPLPSARGHSMIEVLITIIILAIGLMGVAALMSVSIRQQHETRIHTRAVFVGEAMMERMRANPVGVWQQAYDGTYASGMDLDGTQCPVGNPCTPAQVALRDRDQWLIELEQFLIGPQASITCQVGASPVDLALAPPLNGFCDLTMSWLEVDHAAGGSDAPILSSISWRFVP